MKSCLPERPSEPLRVAIVMDGNGRWATARGLPRQAGHRAGVTALRRVVEAAPALGIGTLGVYAFSTANWQRPRQEVDALMGLMRRFLRNESSALASAGVRLTAIGRRDRLPAGLADLLAHAEATTAAGTALDLRIAVDYSGRDAILEAIAAAGPGAATREQISRHLASRFGGPDIDLLIRTGGEQRLSDFMLWEAAYAELYFTPVPWPAFDGEALAQAVRTYHTRERRFGALPTGDRVRSTTFRRSRDTPPHRQRGAQGRVPTG
jgi:undecaprenyl diphosphate synthase